MQAHEIIHREHTFQAKYGKKMTSELDNDVNSDVTSIDVKSPQVVRHEKMPQYAIKTFAFPPKTVQQDKKDLLVHAAQCNWFKNDIIESGILNKDKGMCWITVGY